MINLKKYYLNDFRKDLLKIQFERGNEITNPGDFFFDKTSWTDAIRKLQSNEQKACFIISMFITVASDQTMFTYFRSSYRNFRLLTRYPKFGWTGLGPHNENPLLLIKYPVEQSAIDFQEIEVKFAEAAKLFKDEVKDFFVNHMVGINHDEFIKKFTNDKDTIRIITEDGNMKRLVDKINQQD
jgi:hypothetical protein